MQAMQMQKNRKCKFFHSEGDYKTCNMRCVRCRKGPECEFLATHSCNFWHPKEDYGDVSCTPCRFGADCEFFKSTPFVKPLSDEVGRPRSSSEWTTPTATSARFRTLASRSESAFSGDGTPTPSPRSITVEVPDGAVLKIAGSMTRGADCCDFGVSSPRGSTPHSTPRRTPASRPLSSRATAFSQTRSASSDSCSEVAGITCNFSDLEIDAITKPFVASIMSHVKDVFSHEPLTYKLTDDAYVQTKFELYRKLYTSMYKGGVSATRADELDKYFFGALEFVVNAEREAHDEAIEAELAQEQEAYEASQSSEGGSSVEDVVDGHLESEMDAMHGCGSCA